jgi:hypothetical protein
LARADRLSASVAGKHRTAVRSMFSAYLLLVLAGLALYLVVGLTHH